MKKQSIGRIAGLMAAAAIWMGASANANAAFMFQKITTNSPLNLSGQLSMEVSGSGQNLVLSFYNNVGVASSITDIYIDAPPQGAAQLPNPYFTGNPTITASAGVAFSAPANPGNLPGGVDYNFASVAQSADSNDPAPANGVNANGEWVQLAYTLSGPTTVADVLAGLASGEFRVGLHVQGIPHGDGTTSDAYINVGPVPEPSTVLAGGLLLLPFAMSTLRMLRRKRTA